MMNYAGGAQQLRDAVSQIRPTDWDALPVEGMWSIRQVLCHLADAEIIYADRMKRVIAEENPTFFDADPDVFVPALHCPKRNTQQEVDLVAAVRAHMSTILEACSLEDFQRTGVHSLEGPMTLETLLERITEHLPHHLKFIEQKLQVLQAVT